MVQVTARCGNCRSILTWDEHTVTRTTVLLCSKCGEENGTYGEFEDGAALAVKDRIDRILGGEE